MKRLHYFRLLLHLLPLGAAAGGVQAHDAIVAVRGLTAKTEWVVRGTVLDQELAPGGLWHRLRVEEVLWPPPREDGPGAPEIGPTLKVFAHGPGVPEGASLAVGDEVIAGAQPLPPADADLGPWERKLWAGFRPDRPGERPAILSADGIVSISEDPSRLKAVRRIVTAARDGGQPLEARRALFLELAGNPLAAIREEALRQLARPEIGLAPEARAQAVALFAAEVDGPANPEVLTAHLELQEPWRQVELAPVLVRLIAGAPREDVAQRAGIALAETGRAEDFQALSRSFDSARTEAQISMLRALGSTGREEHLRVLARGLKARDLAARVAAAEALGGHPSPGAEGLLREAAQSTEPEVSRAAARALERNREEFRLRNSKGVTPADGPARMEAIFQAARRRLQEERSGTGRASEGSPP